MALNVNSVVVFGRISPVMDEKKRLLIGEHLLRKFNTGTHALHSVVNEADGELMWASFWWDIMAPRDRNDSAAREENHAECDVFNDR